MSAAAVFLGGVGYIVEADTPGDLAVTVATPAPPGGGPVAVVGDSYSATQVDGQGWAQVVADRLDVEVENLAIGGSGYVRAYPGAVGSTFPAQVATRLPADAAVVVVFGGLNDHWAPEPVANVGEAARATFAAVRRLAPAAVLIVAGPQWQDGNPPAVLWQFRDAVHAAAVEFGAVWVDPLGERWFADPATIGPDGLHPSLPRGQLVIADRLAPLIADALGE